MGEKEGPKNEGEKKDDGNGTAVVLKMDMHCRGCAKKIRQAVKKSGGVEDVKVDFASNKLTVTGKVEPAKIKDALETKTKRKVEIVSPLPKKDGGGDKKPEEKTEKKPEKKPEKKTEEKKTEEKNAEDKKAEDKKPKETTVVFKIRTHCDSCIRKMNKIISRIEGVNAVSIDEAKDLVTVTGTADPKEMITYLREKLNRSVEVVPTPAAKKDDGASDKKDKEGGGGKKKDKQVGGGGDKKEKEAAAGGGEKDGGGKKKGKGESEKEDGGGSEAPKMELSKMEYGGHSAPPPMYWSEGTSYAQSYSHNYAPTQSYPHNYAPTQSYPHNYAHNYAMEPYNYQAGYANQGYPNHYAHEGYPNHYTHEGYGMPMDHRLHPMDPRLNPPQMFSDENPNACSVM